MSTDAPQAAAPRTHNPFPGLRPFREDEEHLFFGRESQVDAMVNKLAETHFLAVVGPSGSGKSSLVNCGLRPALHGGYLVQAGTTWKMAQFRPGSDALLAMAGALAEDGVLFRNYQEGGVSLAEIVETTLRMSKLGLIDIYQQAQLDPGVNLLVVVDQFEELFRYQSLGSGQQENAFGVSEEATAFVNLLLEAHYQTEYPIHVVITMRSDFLGDCAQFPGLAEAINAGQYLVPRMTRDERRVAISGPAGVGGAQISPVLLTRLVNDVGDNPDQLSILQHALNRTWAQWERDGGQGALELHHYEAIGTMAHALDRHADDAYTELRTEREQQICERLFKAITDKATDPRGVRRPTTMGTLCALTGASAEELTAVIEVFRHPSRSFLMPPASDELTEDRVIDISHESLMRVWRKLNSWADEEAQSAGTYRRLAETAVLHANDQASLWRDPDLSLAIAWREKEEPSEAWADRYQTGFGAAMEFLDKSKRTSDAEVAAKEEQRRRQLRRSRIYTAVLGIAFLAALALGIWAAQQKKEAQVQAERAKEQGELAGKQRDIARRQSEEAIKQAKIAKEKGELAEQQSKEAKEQARIAAVNASRVFVAQARQANQRGAYLEAARLALEALPSSIENPDKPYLPSAEVELNAAAFNLQDNTVLAGHTGRVTFAAFDSTGQRLLTASHDGSARIWDAATAELVATLKSGGGRVAHAAFSPNGQLVATAAQAAVEVWDTTTGRRVQSIEGGATFVSFSRDDSRLAYAGWDGAVLWDLPQGQPIATVAKNAFAVHAVFSAKGDLLVTSDRFDGVAQIWNGRTGKAVADLKGHSAGLYYVTFSPTGTEVLTASADATARIWDGKTGRTIKVLSGHSGKVFHADFSPDGQHVVTASKDGTARIWDVESGSARAVLKHDGEVRHAAFSPAGPFVVTASRDDTARIWDFDGNLVATLAGHTADVTHSVFSPDGTQILTTGDTTARVWAANGDKSAVTLRGHSEPVGILAFSPDRKILATGSGISPSVGETSKDSTVRLWNVETGALLHVLKRHTAEVESLNFSRDGSRLLSSGFSAYNDDTGNAWLWDTRTGKELQRFPHAIDADLSPDGTLVATRSWPSANVWDAKTGELIESLGERTKAPGYVEFSRDGKWLAYTTSDNTIQIRNVKNGGEGVVIKGGGLGKPNIEYFTLSSDASRMVTLGAHRFAGNSRASRQVGLWDTETGKLVTTLKGHRDTVSDVAFSPDGLLIATCSGSESDQTRGDRSDSKDNRVLVWDARNGKLLQEFEGHIRPLESVAFSPDSQHVVSASRDGTARVWDLRKRAAIAVLAHQSWVNDVAFGMDGDSVATVSGYEYDESAKPETTGRLWRLFPDTQSLIDHVRKKLPPETEQPPEGE